MNTHIWAAGVLIIFILMECAEKYLGYGILTLVYLLVFWVMPNKIIKILYMPKGVLEKKQVKHFCQN